MGNVNYDYLVQRLFSVIFSGLSFSLFIFLFLVAKPAFAISDCSVVASPRTISSGSSSSISFTITNSDTSGETAIWVSITPTSSDFTIGSGSADGWAVINGGGNIFFENGNLAVEEPQTFVVNVSASTSFVSNAQWVVELSGSAGGGSPTGCSGETGVTISTISISNITVSDIGENSALVSWTTNIDANSRLDWGTTSSYGSTTSDLVTYATSHSLTMTGLSSNTPYHIKVSSATTSGDSISSSDGTFTTAKSGTTTTVTITNTTTTTKNITKYLTDTVKPSAVIKTDLHKVYSTAPTIEGLAKDDIGISLVEYSIDDGKNWYAINLSNKIGSKSVNFSFTPQVIDDGNYKIKIRATDSSGNNYVSNASVLIIDRLPPAIGGVLYSLGAIILSPQANGSVLSVKSLPQKVTLSAVGGPVSITLSFAGKTYSLTKNPESNLWSGIVNFDIGTHQLIAYAIDGAGNTTQRILDTFNVVPSGKVTFNGEGLSDAYVSVYYFDETSNRFVLWQSSNYGQANPVKTNNEGEYQFLLPAGKYYLEVKKEGYATTNSEIFFINQDTPIATDISIKSNKYVHIGPFYLYLPYFPDIIKMRFALPDSLKIPNKALGKELPNFSLYDSTKVVDNLSLHGKPTVITFLNSWLPQSSHVLAILSSLALDKRYNVLSILEQETVSSVVLFQKRGNYNVSILADPDGIFINPLNLSSLPLTVFIDKKGIVRKIKSGVLTEQEMINDLGDL